MPRNADESSRRNRYREKRYKSRERSTSRERYKEKRYKEQHKKSSYERSSPSYRSTSSRKSKSRHRIQNKSSRRSSSRSSSTSSASTKSRSSPEILKNAEYTGPKIINLEPVNEDIKRQIIDEIEEDSFVAKSFTSAKKISDKVIIDLQKETISIPKVEKTGDDEQQIIHQNFLGNSDQRLEKWVKKLFNYRQRYVNE